MSAVVLFKWDSFDMRVLFGPGCGSNMFLFYGIWNEGKKDEETEHLAIHSHKKRVKHRFSVSFVWCLFDGHVGASLEECCCRSESSNFLI